VDNPADKSLNSDGPHQLSISGQSVQRDGAASHFQPQKQHTNFSYTLNRPGMSGDSTSWEGWSHVRWFVEEVPAGAA
jgi:hypothetical protein